MLNGPIERDPAVGLPVLTGAEQADAIDVLSTTEPMKPSVRQKAPRAEKPWRTRYRNYLRVSDLSIVSLAVFGAQFLRFGTEADEYSVSWIPGIDVRVTYTALSSLLIFGWMLSLSLRGTRDHKITGTGVSEYKRIVEATIRLFGVLAIVDLLFRLSISRGYLLISFPAGLLLLLVSRWLWRKWLYRMRSEGNCLDRAVVVGELAPASHDAKQVSRGP